MQKDVNERCTSLTDLVKNIVIGFCKINVPYAERLDVYGSVHIRADDCDVINFMLNEHCYNSRASSPTATSAVPVYQELQETAGNSNGSRRRGSRKNLQKRAVKTEMSVGNAEDPNGLAGLPVWQWSDAESVNMQQQQKSFLQPSCSTSQPVSAARGKYSDSDAVSNNLVSGAASDAEGCVKCEKEATVDDDQLSNDGSVEILDDDPADWRQDTDYVHDDISAASAFKSEFLETKEEYKSEMPYGYDNYAQYDDSNPAAYQYANVSASNYASRQPRVTASAKRFKSSASIIGQNAPTASAKTCEYCQERFSSDAQLSTHFEQYHQCTMPQVNAPNTKRKTQSHQVGPTTNSSNTEECVIRMYKCLLCDQMFKSQDGLRNHDNVKHSRTKRYQCSFCSQEFLTRQSAYIHRVKFHRLLVKKPQ